MDLHLAEQAMERVDIDHDTARPKQKLELIGTIALREIVNASEFPSMVSDLILTIFSGDEDVKARRELKWNEQPSSTTRRRTTPPAVHPRRAYPY